MVFYPFANFCFVLNIFNFVACLLNSMTNNLYSLTQCSQSSLWGNFRHVKKHMPFMVPAIDLSMSCD